MLSLNQNRLLRRFLDGKIALLHWARIFFKQLYNLDLKFKIWPRKGRTIKRSFLGTVTQVLKSY